VTVSARTSQEPSGHGPITGFVGQFTLFAALGAGVGLGTAGWVVGTAYAVAVWAMLTRAMHRTGTRVLGPANAVTLARATLAGGVAALVATSFATGTPVAVLVILATIALLLDAVDGQVARRTGTTSRLGARFDMEVDAFLILVLSVYVAADLGPWVLAIGAARYAFAAAAWALPWMTAPLPPALWRKTVAAAQGIVLVVAASGLLPFAAAVAVVALALASLAWSFGRDTWWLWRTEQHRRTHAAPAELARAAR
jgi:phosphatidylglycerophosphate synthase